MRCVEAAGNETQEASAIEGDSGGLENQLTYRSNYRRLSRLAVDVEYPAGTQNLPCMRQRFGDAGEILNTIVPLIPPV
jgi:hypothetical protein